MIGQPTPTTPIAKGPAADPRLRKAFDAFVGESLYGQMLKSMRATLDKPAYFNGGHAEDAFNQQLDQMLAQKLSSASAHKFTGPMFDLFNLRRQ